jgi:Flp pilus assembly protein TadD
MPFARRNVEVLERGIASIQRAVELDPTNSEYVAWLGRAYHQADDLANARRCLEKAVELDPANATAHKRLGMVYAADSETELAKSAFERALALDPKDASSHFQLGQALEVLRDPAGARAAYERAIANNPTRPEYYRTLMAVLVRLGETGAADEAERNLARWTEHDAKLQRRQRNVDKNPRDAAALRRLGEAYLEGERWGLAAEWCTKAVLVDPKDVQAHLCCGIERRRLEEYEMAEKHLREAEFLEPMFLDPKLERVRLYAATGAERALAELVAEVESRARSDGQTLFDLGTVCEEVGRKEDARRLLAAAKALSVTEPPPAETVEPPGGG